MKLEIKSISKLKARLKSVRSDGFRSLTTCLVRKQVEMKQLMIDLGRTTRRDQISIVLAPSVSLTLRNVRLLCRIDRASEASAQVTMMTLESRIDCRHNVMFKFESLYSDDDDDDVVVVLFISM